jgi:hypothetical protein
MYGVHSYVWYCKFITIHVFSQVQLQCTNAIEPNSRLLIHSLLSLNTKSCRIDMPGIKCEPTVIGDAK